jgi:hypothetical protein
MMKRKEKVDAKNAVQAPRSKEPIPLSDMECIALEGVRKDLRDLQAKDYHFTRLVAKAHGLDMKTFGKEWYIPEGANIIVFVEPKKEESKDESREETILEKPQSPRLQLERPVEETKTDVTLDKEGTKDFLDKSSNLISKAETVNEAIQ